MYKVSEHLRDEMRMVRAKGQLCFMAANLRVEVKDLETIIKGGIVTERWLYWRFICDAVTHVLVFKDGKKQWKEHKIAYFQREHAQRQARVSRAVRNAIAQDKSDSTTRSEVTMNQK